MIKIITTASAALMLLSTAAHAGAVTTSCSTQYTRGWSARVCETTVTRDPEPAAEQTPLRGSATSETVTYNVAEAARVLAIPKRMPGSPLCVAPYRMTLRDGCQR